ncbi:MAG TPA: response regulator transcription factor [Verrucomicrobiae bacterium]|jgi:DNA-binding NarL/FixJ family response regulator|nr:response regulator transcription factor [Verrucomicrobiae bacterium]
MAPISTTEPDSPKSKIFIVDDHALVREWLSTLINQQTDLEVCGEANSAAEALELIGSAKPHVAVVDVSMEGGSGIELIKNIKAICPVIPEVAVIVLSMHDELLYCERALRAGARGYVMKRAATKNVLEAIRCVLKGEMYLNDKMAKLMAEKFVEGKSPAAISPVELLSDRELEVFHLLGRGLGTRQIAEEMHVGFKTVQSFNARIKEKLKLLNATELMREALRWHDSQQQK